MAIGCNHKLTEGRYDGPLTYAFQRKDAASTLAPKPPASGNGNLRLSDDGSGGAKLDVGFSVWPALRCTLHATPSPSSKTSFEIAATPCTAQQRNETQLLPSLTMTRFDVTVSGKLERISSEELKLTLVIDEPTEIVTASLEASFTPSRP